MAKNNTGLPDIDTSNRGIRNVAPQTGPKETEEKSSDEPSLGAYAAQSAGRSILNALKDYAGKMASGMAGAGIALGRGLKGLLKSGLKNSVHAATRAFGKASGVIAHALNISSKAAGGTMVVGVAALIATSVMAYQSFTLQRHIQKTDELVIFENCDGEIKEMKDSVDGDAVDADAQTRENYGKLYALFTKLGYTKEMVAGMLGNMGVESGGGHADPTAIEAYYLIDAGLSYRMDSGKNSVMASPSSRDSYASSYISTARTNRGAYIWSHPGDNMAAPGCGLIQFTGGRGATLYYDMVGKSQDVFGEKREWYDFDLQVVCMLTLDATADWVREGWVRDNKTSDVSTATVMFFNAVEWCSGDLSAPIRSDCGPDMRQSYARNALGILNSVDQDTAWADSILAAVEKVTGAEIQGEIAEKETECGEEESEVDNGTIADAAAALAYPPTDPGAASGAHGAGLHGTDLYRQVHDATGHYAGTGGGGGYCEYCDCGKTVSTIVRWSGVDDSFPECWTRAIISYCSGSPKWEKVVGPGGLSDESVLKPGDVLVYDRGGDAGSGHTLIFAGPEAIEKVHHITEPHFVQGSLNHHGAAVGNIGTYGEQWYVFRCIQPDSSSQYKNIAVGRTGDRS